MLGELDIAREEVTRGLEEYKFNEAAGALYRFIWNTLCDWYLELIKPLLNGRDGQATTESRLVCGYVIDEALKLLHPFMPFITEELWERRAPGRREAEGFLMLQSWPSATGFRDPGAAAEIGWLIDLITEIRSVRSDLGVPAGAKVPLTLIRPGKDAAALADAHASIIERLARVSEISLADDLPAGAVSSIAGDTAIGLAIADLIDITAEKARLAKRVGELDKEIASLEGRLGNDSFISRAPAEIVDEQRQRLGEAQAARAKLDASRRQLDGLGQTS
jgi:valyl-tRNA synthetase